MAKPWTSKDVPPNFVLRRARLAKGLKQAELGLAVGISESQISRYETGGERQPYIGHLVRLAGVLELPILDLIAPYVSEADLHIADTARIDADSLESMRRIVSEEVADAVNRYLEGGRKPPKKREPSNTMGLSQAPDKAPRSSQK